MLSAMIGGSFTTMAFQGLQIPIIIIIIIIIIICLGLGWLSRL